MGLLDMLLGGPKVLPTSVNDDNFEQEVLRSELPVLLDAWSPGCAPCKRLEEVVVNIAKDYDGRLKVCEMNVATSPRVGVSLQIRSTPTVLYFDGGKLKERVTGFHGSLYHRQTIEELFGL